MDISINQIVIITMVYTVIEIFAIATGGGGSFLRQPFLLFMGLPPKQAIATDIVTDIVGESTMIYQFNKRKLIFWRIGLLFAFCSSIGALFGNYIFYQIDSANLVKLLTVLVVIFTIYNCYKVFINSSKKDPNEISVKKLTNKQIYFYGIFFGLIMGAYNNIISAGEGNIVTMILLYFFGFKYLEARGTAQLIFVPARFIAIIFGFYKGILYLPLLIPIWLGGFISGYLGSKINFVLPERYLKMAFTFLTIGISIKLVLDNF